MRSSEEIEWNQFIHMMFRSNRAVVVAQLVEWLLPTPEVRCLNPVISKIYMEHILFIVNCFKKAKYLEKEAMNGPFKKDHIAL